MKQNRNEDLLMRAEPLERAEEISHKMVDVVRVEDDALLLDAKHEWAEAICAVLDEKGVEVKEIRRGDYGRAANSLKPRSVPTQTTTNKGVISNG